MIIARPMERPQGEPLGPRTAHAPLELTRLIPLELVSLYLHDMGEQRLKLRLATGRVYYLKLCAPRGEERPLFARWLRLIYLLRAPPDSWASIPSWHTSNLRGRSAKPPHSQQLRPIQEEEEPRALIPQPGEPPGSGSRTPSQGQLRGRQHPASPTTGQQPSTRRVGGQGPTCSTSPSIALVRRSPKLLDGLSGSRAEVTSPWTQGPMSRELSAERNRGQLSLAIPSGSRSPAGTPSQRGSSARSRATMAPGSPERSRASVGMGHSAVGTASVGVGRSAVAMVSAAAGPSRPTSARPSGMGREMEPGERCREPSMETRQAQSGCASPSTEQGRSCSQSQRGSNAASRAAVAPGSPERSRASVGVGRSAVGTASMGVGRSVVGTTSVGVGHSAVATVSAAAGPSRPTSARPSGMGREMEPGERCREPSTETRQAQSGCASPSTEQGRSCSQSQGGSNAASRAAVAPGSPERSRASVGVGRSAGGTASVGVGRSVVGTTSVGVGRSAVATVSAAAGPSRPTSARPSGMGREMEPGKRCREPSTETRQAQSGCASPSMEQGRSCSQSQRGSNAASRAAVAPSSPERSRASVGVGRSAGGTASVGVGHSLPSTASVAVGPSNLASTQLSGMEPDRRSGERSRAQLGHTSPSTEQGRSCSRSQHGSSAAPGPTRATVTSSSHGQPSSSRAPSFSEPASSPMAAAAPPERSQLSGGVGPSEVATAALAMDPSGQKSRNSSGLHRAERQGRRSRETVGESSKGKARSSSGSPSHKRPSKEKRVESKGKLKSALGSARHRSSLTFVTIYSVLSNSLDKLTGRKLRQRRSQEDAKTQLSSKPSKRVTISGVVELSVPGSQETSSVAPSAIESTRVQGPAGSGAAPQRESGPLPKVQSGRSRAATVPSPPERSRASVGVGHSAVATASVGVGHSAVATASAAVGPSRLGSARTSGMGGEKDPGRRSRELSVERSRAQQGHASPSTEQGRSRSRSPMGRPSQPGSSAVSGDSGAARLSERSRVSVAAGPSERSRVSVAAGPSEMATVSVAVGPSELEPWSSARLSGRDQLSLPGRGSRECSKAGSSTRKSGTPSAVAALGMEGDDVSRETSKKSRASVVLSSPERSRPVALDSAEKSRASVAPGSPKRFSVSVASGPSERSKASVAAGPSEMATVSVAVGRSEPGSLSSSWTPGTDAQRAPNAGKSRLSSPCSGAPLGTEAGHASPGSATLGTSREQSRSLAREEAGARSQSPSSQAPHARAAVSGPRSTRPSELDRQGEPGWGSSRPSATRSRSKGRKEDKQDPSVGHPASKGGSERAADRMKSQ
ncbi:uncharacterized protein LOC125627927 [Caretta caretta]|uniref:uncharacterized protein LOC125627927 n=1 Tax=Caretta caretta TaxID=8467 RepID=UPI003F4B2E48